MTESTRPVVVLGDANVDLTLHVPARGSDGRRAVREPVLSGGGTAANTAFALARLGVPVAFIGAVGDDAFGRRATADLASAGVDVGRVVVVDTPTCQVIAMIEPDGERSLVVWPPDGGALRQLRPIDVPSSALAGAAWLHTTGMCLRDEPVRSAVLAAMAAARAAGVPVSIDLNLRVELWGLDAGRREAVAQAIVLADVVLGSGQEELAPLAAAIDGQPAAVAASLSAVEAAASRLADGRRIVVARLGADGATACTADGSVVRVPAYRVPAANVIGAGDAFNAGFIATLVEGAALDEALRRGNALAALKVARPGGPRDLPDAAEVEALLAETR